MAKQDVELQFKLIDGVSKGLASIQQGVNGLGASLVKINAAAELTGKAFGAISSVAGAFGDAITGAASVEDALTRVNTITRATVEEQKALQDAVRGAVEGTRFSAEEAAGALVLLAEDGFSAKEAVDQLGSVLQFAQANAQSAATAAGALGAVLDTFGEKPQLIGALADKLTAVAVGAGVSTKALQEGLAGVGNAADQAGLSLDETIGYLGLLASRGIEGGAAVNRFNLIIRDLADPASKAGKEIQALGLDASDFAGVLNKLGTDSVSAEKVLSALGKKPREALRILLQEGGGDLGKFRKILDESAGATKAASDALNNTFAGALERIQNQLAQTRNDLLTPILAPLADEIQALSARLLAFSKSEDFKLIVAKFSEFATDAVKYIGDVVAAFDFESAIASTVQFASDVETNLAAVRSAFEFTISSAANFGDGVSAAFNASVSAVSLSLANLTGALASFSDEADGLSLSLAKIGRDASIATGDALGRIAERAARSAKALADAEKEATKFGKAVTETVAPLNAFGKSLEDRLANATSLPPAFDATRNSVMRLTEEQKRLTAVQEESQRAMSAASVASYEAQLRRLVVAQNELIQSGVTSGAEFSNYSKKIAETEAKIAALEASTKGATQATEQQIQVVKRLKQELQNLGDQQDDVDKGNKKLAKSNSQVSDSFGNIDRQSSSAAVSMGNLTEAFVRQALEAAGTSKSMRDYLRTLNDFFAQGADEEEQLLNAIELRRRQNAELTEEDRIRQKIINQYGESSSLVEVLVQEELKLAEARRRGNDEAERGIEIEQRRRGQAGGLGAAGSAADTAPGASAGRGNVTSATRADSPINITINQNGATPETIRDLAPLIERELGRLGALRR